MKKLKGEPKSLRENSALSPLGESVGRDGVLTSRRGTSEGVPPSIGHLATRGFHTVAHVASRHPEA